MEFEYTYGVARVRALESSLFTSDTLESMLQCKDYEECLGFLRDKGWGNGNTEQSAQQMLNEEKSKAWKVLDELIENEEDRNVLVVGNEFHNLKAAIKSVCTGQENGSIFIENTRLDPELLKEAIRQGEYGLLPKEMADVAKEATEVLLQTGDGQLCDIIIDRATLEAIKRASELSTNEFIRKYADMQVMIADIKIAVRCAATGKDSSFVEKALVACGSISITDLTKAVDGGLEEVCEYLNNAGFKECVTALQKSKSAFECWCDNKVIEEMKSQKYDSFSVGPIVAYVLARENEIKTVKIILSGKLNGFDNDIIKERVREMYA